MGEAVLSIRDLSVEIPTRHGIVKPVDGVSYDIRAGEILGVVGESGAGKSMAGNAVIGLLNPPAHISSGEVWLNGKRIDGLGAEDARRLRGKEIGMVFQDPLTSLNPLLTIGDQLTETILTPLPVSRGEADKRAVAALEAKRYLARATDETDRRLERLTLTRAGQRVFADLASYAYEYDRALASIFTDEEQDILRRTLAKIAERG